MSSKNWSLYAQASAYTVHKLELEKEKYTYLSKYTMIKNGNNNGSMYEEDHNLTTLNSTSEALLKQEEEEN